MNRGEHFQHTLRKVEEERKNGKQYTEDSIDEARTKLQEVSDTLAHVKSGGRSIYRHDELLRMEHAAHQELEDAIHHAAPLAARKRAREFAEKREQERHTEQVQHAASEKAAFLASAKTKWLAAGGNEHSFNERSEGMWVDEVQRRTQGPSEVEKFSAKRRATGMYSI